MKSYSIYRLTRPAQVHANWDQAPWSGIEALSINQFSGNQPVHMPQVEARLAYDEEALYAIFRVADRYVRAMPRKYQDEVFKDSCVEFFFTPGMDREPGYFNLEVNCGGQALFHHQQGRAVADRLIAFEDFRQIQIAHTLPGVVYPEIKEAITWGVAYRLPFAILSRYTRCEIPQPGTIWRANLYKCADESSHPHWLSWAPVDTPTPDFHRPEYFGQLVF